MLLVCGTLRTTGLKDVKNVQPLSHRYEGKKYCVTTISSFSLSFFKSLKLAVIKEFSSQLQLTQRSITKISIAPKWFFKHSKKGSRSKYICPDNVSQESACALKTTVVETDHKRF